MIQILYLCQVALGREWTRVRALTHRTATAHDTAIASRQKVCVGEGEGVRGFTSEIKGRESQGTNIRPELCRDVNFGKDGLQSQQEYGEKVQIKDLIEFVQEAAGTLRKDASDTAEEACDSAISPQPKSLRLQEIHENDDNTVDEQK